MSNVGAIEYVQRKKRFASPRYQLVQVGTARAPVSNATTELLYTPRASTITMHNGSIYDFQRYWPNAVMRGRFQHSGIYRCLGDYDCQVASDETHAIQTAKQIYKPVIFYQHADCYSPMGSDLQGPGCGKWLYAMGKVTEVSSPFNVNMALDSGIDFAFAGELETPLVECSWTRFRYGPPLAQLSTDQRYIGRVEDEEASEFDPFPPWFIPCGPPMQNEVQRFWPRNTNSGLFGPAVQFIPATWGASKIETFIPGETRRVYVDGNSIPRVRWLVDWDFSVDYNVVVNNELGRREYDYTYVAPTNYQELFDNWSETALINRSDVVTYDTTAAMGPLLVPGWNEIDVGDQPTTIGISYAWIN